MRAASEIEKQYTAAPVRVVTAFNEGHGSLSLSGRNTSLTLNTRKFLATGNAQNGWFDLTVEEASGSAILLLNAIANEQVKPRPDRQEWQSHIFPNIVVLNASPLLPSGTIREISFSLEGLDRLFAYEITETQHLYNATSKQRAILRQLRNNERVYPRQYSFFKPRTVVLIHDLPTVVRERVAERRYDICVGHSVKHALRKVTIEPVFRATIRFDKPVTITGALDDLWAWRRFFQQMAMRPLAFLSIECRAGLGRRDHWSEIYLPNLEPERTQGDLGALEFGPRHNPYGDWKDRKAFAATMKSWLEKDEARRQFRVRLDRVIEEMTQTSSTGLIAELCSAIETLPELSRPSDFTSEDFDAIVDAAAEVGTTLCPPIPRERIAGLLGLLQHTSLPQRLKALVAEVDPEVPKALARDVVKHAREFRTFEAHGGAWDEMTMPLVDPTLHMLAAMCVLWDLKSVGFPAKNGERGLKAMTHVNFFKLAFSLPRDVSAQTVPR